MIAIADDPTRFPLSEPTPTEIALRCAAIRARWSEDEHRRRSFHVAGHFWQAIEGQTVETAIVSAVDLSWAARE